MKMTPTQRRILQAVLYEAFAVSFVGPGLSFLLGSPALSSIKLAIFMSTIALTWSFIFNTAFERWESKQKETTRSWARRAVHTTGFEGGLVVMLVPIMAWWLGTTLLVAFLADLAVLAFFFVYSFVFTWAFDQVFGLPASVTHKCEA